MRRKLHGSYTEVTRELRDGSYTEVTRGTGYIDSMAQGIDGDGRNISRYNGRIY